MGSSNAVPDNEVARTIAAGFPVIYVLTWEEERLENMLASASLLLFGDDRSVWLWSTAGGFSNGPGRDLNLTDPVDALTFIAGEDTDVLCLMKDLPAQLDSNPALIRAVRDVYDVFSSRPGAVVLSHPRVIVPTTLSKELYLLELPLPDEQELLALLRSLNEDYDQSERPSDEWLEQISFAMHGLSSNEARDLFRRLMSESVLDSDGKAIHI